jgi:hypothetical protein
MAKTVSKMCSISAIMALKSSWYTFQEKGFSEIKIKNLKHNKFKNYEPRTL